MSKETILEEFNEFTKTLEADFITEGYSAYGDLEDFISKTIDRVREETIREVEEIIEKGKGYYSSEEMRDGYYILKDLQQSLNKLKK